MRKRLIICALTALLVFSGASPWEGAAAVAPAGELPATGFYVATNSFPRNTVVDITNIETGKSTRVIVANSLESQGLLAIVSREAAELIGMKPGSISRIRMVQPSDPIAYLRFIEGMAAGIPPYDSGNVISDDIYSTDTYIPPAVSQSNVPFSLTGPSYILEPEWQIPEIIADISIFNELDKPLTTSPSQSLTEQVPEYIAKTAIEEEPQAPATQSPVPEEEPDYIAETVIEEESPLTPGTLSPVLTDEPEYIAETVIEEESPLTPGTLSPVPEEEPVLVTEVPSLPEPREYNLVPAPERPPVSIYGIDPSEIIPPITPPVVSEVTPETPVRETERPVTSVTDAAFSVPRINELNSGWYYVQIAALESPDSVENFLRQIDHSYKPVVYKDGDNLYRILLGPLNQGESAAILQRFRSIGYRDAFVRHAR